MEVVSSHTSPTQLPSTLTNKIPQQQKKKEKKIKERKKEKRTAVANPLSQKYINILPRIFLHH